MRKTLRKVRRSCLEMQIPHSFVQQYSISFLAEIRNVIILARHRHITKQGNSLLRFLLVEAAQVTVRSEQEWRSKYFHLAMRRGRKIAKVAMARKLAVRMYWMWRKGWDYEQLAKFGSHAGQPGYRDGVR